jgi:hypothetical protein
MRVVGGLCDVVAMVDKGGGEGRRAGEEGGDKTEGKAGTAAVSKGRYHNVVLALHSLE